MPESLQLGKFLTRFVCFRLVALYISTLPLKVFNHKIERDAVTGMEKKAIVPMKSIKQKQKTTPSQSLNSDQSYYHDKVFWA